MAEDVIKARLDNIETVFSENVTGVHKLMHFDKDVLEHAISGIKALSERLKNHHKLDNPQLSAENTLKTLENIHNNNSLRPRYEVIFNQAIVLLVSYFGSAVEDIFKAGIHNMLERENDSNLLKEDIKLSFRELKDANWNLRDIAGDLLVEKKDLSFQDMQAIHRAFKEYLTISIEKDNLVNNIILAQACRHVIVHPGGVASERLTRQLKGAFPRDVKSEIIKDTKVQFSPDEVKTISESMEKYVTALVKKTYSASIQNQK